jgi:tetratricopeptide (TPR) repeat protein
VAETEVARRAGTIEYIDLLDRPAPPAPRHHELAERFRELRERAGLTKTALAKPRYTVSYVSQIESGRRNPSSEALAFFSQRLGVSPQYLTTGIPEGIDLRLRYRLEEGRTALREARIEDAERLATSVIAQAEEYDLQGLLAQALVMRGDALTLRGRLREAVDQYERALEGDLPAREAGLAVAALARAYRTVGDLSYAADVVETFLAKRNRGPLDAVVVADLQTVLVSIYFERGDILRAERAAKRALTAADQGGSLEVRAKAYWDASRVLAESHQWGEALDFASRARVLMEELDDRRRVARLHNAYAFLCLEVEPPRTAEAGSHLDRAEALLDRAGAPGDLAYVYTERSRLALLAKHPEEALQHASRALKEPTADETELARAMFLQGRSLALLGRTPEARSVLTAAAEQFKSRGARQQVASCWRELGEMDIESGDLEAAVRSLRAGLEVLNPRRERA